MSYSETELELVKYAKTLLRLVRERVRSTDFNESRLPRWLDHSKVEIGHQCNTLLLLFQPSTRNRDEFDVVGKVSSVMEFIFSEEYPKRIPSSAVGREAREMGQWPGQIIVTNLTLDLGENRGDLIGLNYDYHSPFIFPNVISKFERDGIPSTRDVPYFIGLHTDEWMEMDAHLQKRSKDIVESLEFVVNSNIGDQYEEERAVEDVLYSRKEKGVIVLGNYDTPYLKELNRVRDELKYLGYDAHLLVDLPDFPGVGWREKLRVWTSTARFSVLIDREASGANNEFEMLREQETVLALLRPSGGGSSNMLPDDTSRLGGSIESFRFEDQATEVIEDAVGWAESLIGS